MNAVQSLITAIETGDLLVPAMFDIDIDTALDSRDESEFDRKWVSASSILAGVDITADQRELLDRLREVAFKRTFESTRNADLAGYVSDDFELIGLAFLVRSNDGWLNALWNEYRQHQFPHGKLALSVGAFQCAPFE